MTESVVLDVVTEAVTLDVVDESVTLDVVEESVILEIIGEVGPRGPQGEQGEQGPPGAPGIGGQPYIWDQLVPSTVWGPIPHGLGRSPSIVINDSAGNRVEGDPYDVDSNHTLLTFGFAFSGRATLV